MKPRTLREALLCNAEIGPVGPGFLHWAADHQIPLEVLSVFSDCWVKGPEAGVGACDLLGEKEIMNSSDQEPRYLAAGILLIGSCPNGDMVGVDVRDKIGAVGYLSHEHLWEDKTLDARRYFAVVADSISTFAIRSWDDDFPYDYWDAIDGDGG